MTVLDISHHQQTFDARVAQAAGAVSVVIRTGYGERADTRYPQHQASADAAGLPRMAYWYHLLHQDARRQAELCFERSGGVRRRAWLDFEQSTGNGDLPIPFPRYSDALFWHILSALDRASELFETACGVYSRANFLDHWLTEQQQRVIAQTHPLWLAQWNATATAPDLPLGWDDWMLWQWSNKGQWLGVEGDVDLDRINPRLMLPQVLGEETTMARLKLGPHHMLGGGDTERWLATMPTVAFFTDDFGAALSARTETLTVGRRVDDGLLDGQGFDPNRIRHEKIPQQAAEWYFDTIIAPKIATDPHIRAWKGPNEPHPESDPISPDASHQWYSEFCYWLASFIRGAGRVPVVGGFSVGTPPLSAWIHYGLLAQGVLAFGGYLELHEYGPLDGGHALRYRKVEQEFAALGYPRLPMVIGESGGDFVGGHTPFKGSYWGGDEFRYWNEWCLPYETALQADDYVLGAVLFTSGDGGGAWPLFDVTGSGLIHHVELRARELTAQPDPPQTGDEMKYMIEVPDTFSAGDIRAALGTNLLDFYAVIPVAPPPAWWEVEPLPFVAVARTLPLTTYVAPGGAVFDVRPGATYDLNVTARETAAGEGWLQVAPKPLWCKAADLRLK